MTREEAIEILKDLWRTKHSTYLEADIRKALEMAIQALSQEPCDDAISRDAVLNAICDYVALGEFADKSHTFTVRPLEKRIDALPSVTQKSGKWEDLHRCWVCSECGQQTHMEHNYCPNCGARMESEG